MGFGKCNHSLQTFRASSVARGARKAPWFSTTSERFTVSQVEDGLVGRVESTFVRTADAMPEDKFSFAPTNGEFKGVRTFGEMVKHVEGSNYGMAAAMLQEKIPAEVENSFDSLNSKADIMKLLKDSYDLTGIRSLQLDITFGGTTLLCDQITRSNSDKIERCFQLQYSGSCSGRKPPHREPKYLSWPNGLQPRRSPLRHGLLEFPDVSPLQSQRIPRAGKSPETL